MFLVCLVLLSEAAGVCADKAAPAPISIGLLAPPDESDAASLRQGATLAIEHANETPGARARLVVRGRPGQWGTEGDEAAVLALDEEVGGIIAPSTGTASHQILQVAGRTRVPVASLCPDSSVTRTGVPWLVRIVPRSDEEARALFTGLTNGADGKPLRWAALVPPDRAGREAAHDLLAAAKAAGCLLNEPIRLPPKPTDFPPVTEKLLATHPGAILLWTDPATSGLLAHSLRQAGFKGLLAGPGRLRSSTFLSPAGKAAEGIVIPSLSMDWSAGLRPGAIPEPTNAPGRSPALQTRSPSQESNPRATLFAAEYKRRFASEPDFTAEMAYDAAFLLIDVLRQSGDKPPYRAFPLERTQAGASGPLSFDRSGNRLLTLTLLVCRGGQFKPESGNSNAELPSAAESQPKSAGLAQPQRHEERKGGSAPFFLCTAMAQLVRKLRGNFPSWFSCFGGFSLLEIVSDFGFRVSGSAGLCISWFPP